MNNLSVMRACVVCLSLFLTVSQAVGAKSPRHLRRLSKQTLRASVQNPAASQQLSRTAKKVQRGALRAKLNTGASVPGSILKRLPWDPELKIREIVQNFPAPKLFLPAVWEIQQEYGNHNLTALAAKRYYKEHFGLLTPHLHRLFDKIASFQLPGLERRFFTRMQFLAENQRFIVPKISRAAVKPGNIRMRYLTDVGKLTPKSFKEEDLILSVEQAMSPAEQTNVSIRHINGRTSFQVGPNIYEIYEYMGPIDYIPNLYRFLLTNDKPRAPMTIIFDEGAKSLAMYNEDKTLWVRVTPHEYESPKKLHIHLNEQRQIKFVDSNGFEREETVNINLSIPLAIPEGMPRRQPLDRQFLYEKLVLNPVKNLQGSKYVTVERRPIF